MFDITPLHARHRWQLIEIWHAGWHEAHAHLVPSSILRYRSRDDFIVWLSECTDTFAVARTDDKLLGFVSTNGAEVVKLYVESRARSTSVATSLLAHAERTLNQAGHREIELFCTAGNRRAQIFYERQGWTLTRTSKEPLWLPSGVDGQYLAQTHRFCKVVSESHEVSASTLHIDKL